MKMKRLIASILAATMTLSALALPTSAKTLIDKYDEDGYRYLVYQNNDGTKSYFRFSLDTSTKTFQRYELTDEDKATSIDHIASMKYFGKKLTSKTITSDEAWLSTYQYAAAQGAKSLTFKYASSYKNTVEENYSNAVATITDLDSTLSLVWYDDIGTDTYNNISKMVYAYRYGKTSVLSEITWGKNTDYWDNTKLYNKSVAILKECGVKDKTKTDMERAYSLAQWLKDNVEYDHSYAAASYNVYNPIVEHLATCSGYAEAYTLLMRMAGMKCWCVTGYYDYLGVSGFHKWNALRVNGELRFIDTNAITTNQRQIKKVFYTYEEMNKMGYTFDATLEQLEVVCVY